MGRANRDFGTQDACEPPYPAPEGEAASRRTPPHRLYVHLAWRTLAGRPLIGRTRVATAETHLLALCRWLDLDPLEVCVLEDRLHLLVRLPAGQAISDVVRRIQAGSEPLLLRAGIPVRWSRRYAAQTVGPTEVRRVMRRIAARADARADQLRLGIYPG